MASSEQDDRTPATSGRDWDAIIIGAGLQPDPGRGDRRAGVANWTDHVKGLGAGMLSSEVDSWMTGINSNVDGKQRRIVARYSGSAPAYRARCDEVVA